MGLLDDAIREHLELKRSHGADPGEVARAEREALGPVRAGVDLSGESHADPLSPEADAQDSGASGDVPLHEHEDAPGLHDDQAPVPPADHSPLHDVGSPYQRDESSAGGPAAPGGPGGAHAEPASDPSAGKSAQRASNEDVLEETPEFLAQTPEHEGLWFEQSPPRDFDFGR